MRNCSVLVNPQPQTQVRRPSCKDTGEKVEEEEDHLKDIGELLVHLVSSSILCSGDGKVC